MYDPDYTRREIADSLEKLDRMDVIRGWTYHAEHDTFGREAWEIIFAESHPFDEKKYYTRRGIERFLELRGEPDTIPA